MDFGVDPDAIERWVVPKSVKTEHLSVIFQELLKLPAGRCLPKGGCMEVLRLHNVAGDRQAPFLSCLGHFVIPLPHVLYNRLIWAKVDAILLEEPSRETVCSSDVESATVYNDFLANSEVSWAKHACLVSLWYPVSLQELSLRDA